MSFQFWHFLRSGFPPPNGTLKGMSVATARNLCGISGIRAIAQDRQAQRSIIGGQP
ncbi:MAG: hypothetical protein SNJ57_05560 [Cyanobacteriota bacterium]